jgi:hypothetical protein
MFRLTLCGVLALGLSGQAPGQGQKDVSALIGQLGARDYKLREQATKALEALGASALEALRQARASDLPEVRRRADALVRRIEGRIASEEILTPRKVRLTYSDTPLSEVLADLTRKTGAAVQLNDTSGRLAQRKVTLDTGEVPFWEALRLLCAKAGLREVEPPRTAPPAARGGGLSVTIVGGGLKPETKDVLKPRAEDRPPVVALGDGAPPTLPTYVVGSVRLRVVDADVVPLAGRKPGERVATLQALAEPALRWHEVLAVRLERAVDDEGQTRAGQYVALRPPPAARGGGMIIINGQVITADDQPKTDPTRLPLHFQAGAKPATLLKELKGVVSAQVLSAPKALVTVDEVLQAGGKTFSGPQGGEVRLGAVTRREDGQVTVRVEVAPPPRGTSDGSAQTPALMGNILVNGRRLGEPQESLSARNFALLDGKGNPLEVTRAVSTGKFAGRLRGYELTYRQPAGAGAAARFRYIDRSPVVVEVPFTLRDVPLR